LDNTNGLDLNNSHNNSISNNTFSDNQYSLVIHHGSNSNIIWYNEINRGEIGILLKDSSRRNTAHFNRITDTGTWGIDSFNNEEMKINATLNWWGDPSGPYCAYENPVGLGDNVTSYVDFEPWLPFAKIQEIGPNPANESDEISFIGKCYVLFDVGLYLWTSDIDSELYNGTNSSFSSSDLSNGSHNISLRIRDTTLGWSEPSTLTVVVNGRPRADIVSIEPLLVTEGSSITFAGNGTDDGTITQYSWHSSIDSDIYTGGNANFTCSTLSNGTHNISLIVQDDFGVWSEPVFSELFVNGIPLAFIESIAPNFTSEGDSVFLNGGHFDDGNIIVCQWSSDLDGELYNGTNLSISTSDLSNGTHNISYRVCDDLGLWSPPVYGRVTINGIPRAYISSMHPEFIIQGINVSFSCDSIDDGTVDRYVWNSTLNGVLYDGEWKSFETFNLANGTHIISLVVQDDAGTWSYVDNIAIKVSGIPIAKIVSITPNISLQSTNVAFVADGVDDNAITRYVWTSTIDGALYNGTSPSFISESLSNGTHDIWLKVQDEFGFWSEGVNDTVIISGCPTATIISITPDIALSYETIMFIGSGNDDGSISTYRWSSSLDDELFNGTSDNFTKSNLSEGIHTITLAVRDDMGYWSENVTTELNINSRPLISISYLEADAIVTGIVTINGTSGDLDGTVTLVEIKIAGGNWTAVTGTTEWQYELDTTLLEDGPTVIQVRAFDGNHYSELDEIEVTIDNRPDDSDDTTNAILIALIVIIFLIVILGVSIWTKKFQ
jgi:hypothetical protein